MKNVKPCPYCGYEVEVIRMSDKNKQKTYRIQCKHCGAVVARGTKFPNETDKQGQERIKQYEAYLEKKMAPTTFFKQTIAAQQRDERARMSSREDPENDEAE